MFKQQASTLCETWRTSNLLYSFCANRPISLSRTQRIECSEYSQPREILGVHERIRNPKISQYECLYTNSSAVTVYSTASITRIPRYSGESNLLHTESLTNTAKLPYSTTKVLYLCKSVIPDKTNTVTVLYPCKSGSQVLYLCKSVIPDRTNTVKVLYECKSVNSDMHQHTRLQLLYILVQITLKTVHLGKIQYSKAFLRSW